MILLFPPEIAHWPKAAAYLTTSNGESDSPGFPPIVPLMPDILLINATYDVLMVQNYKKKTVRWIVTLIMPVCMIILRFINFSFCFTDQLRAYFC